jgi:hypothetical protein
MTYHDLARRLQDQPFRPFRIRMVNNTSFDVWESWMVTVGESSAVIVTQSATDDRGFRVAKDWRTISIQHILEFSDLDSPQRKGA